MEAVGNNSRRSRRGTVVNESHWQPPGSSSDASTTEPQRGLHCWAFSPSRVNPVSTQKQIHQCSQQLYLLRPQTGNKLAALGWVKGDGRRRRVHPGRFSAGREGAATGHHPHGSRGSVPTERGLRALSQGCGPEEPVDRTVSR